MLKKKNCHNFEFSGLKRIAGVVHPMSYLGYSFQARKIKIVAVLFFLTPPPTHFFLKFDLTLTANNSPLKTATLKKYHIFGILRTSALTWWYPGWRIVFEKFE